MSFFKFLRMSATTLGAAALFFSLTTAAVAGDAITETGVDRVDQVFAPIPELHAQIDADKAKIASAEQGVKDSLGVADVSEINAALEDLKGQANEALTVEMDGTVPRLNLNTEVEVPANVTAAINTVQGAIDDLKAIIDSAPDMLEKAAAVSAEASALAADATTVAKDAGIGAMRIPGFVRTLNANVDVTKTTPDRINGNVAAATSLMGTLTGPFTP